MSSHGSLWLRALSFVAVAVAAHAAVDPADVGVFGDHQPAWRRKVAGSPVPVAFVNPFEEQDAAGDPITRGRFRVSSGLGVPLDTIPADVRAWGKYVLIGQYEDELAGVFQRLVGERFGVFDTETNTFCEIVVDAAANTSVYRIGIADPQARQTRIYFAGFYASGVEGAQFGYVDADLDNPNPCDPATGWPVVKITGQDLNCIRGGQLPGCANDGIVDPDERPCPGGGCTIDGMAVLDPETVVIGNWLSGARHIIVHVDAAGQVTVPDVRVVGPWNPPDNGSICYNTRPVGNPVADQTSLAGDRRFAHGMDVTCDLPDGVPGCAPWVSLCPLDPPPGTCGSGTCAVRYCQAVPSWACASDAECVIQGIPFGPCVDSCRLGHPGNKCTNTGTVCMTGANCPPPGQCGCAAPGGPIQEYGFDGATLTAVSPLFQAAPGVSSGPMGPYDSQGNLWVASSPSANPIHIYKTTTDQEHSYYDPDNAEGSVIVPPDQEMAFSGFTKVTFPGGVQVGNAIYMLGITSLQRATFGYGIWAKDAAYKVAFGSRSVPAEASRCSVTADPCSTDADCGPSGGICHQFGCFTGVFGAPSTGPCTPTLACPSGQECVDLSSSWVKTPAYGGAPPSLWTMTGFQHPVPHGPFGDLRKYPKQAYLSRVPVMTSVPDAVVDGRPSIAWTGGACASHPKQCRMWMAARKDGVVKVRVRDDGTWSSWMTLPTNVATAGAPAIIADPTHVSVFARGSSGQVYVSYLLSPVTCDLGASCTFVNWAQVSTLPGGITATADVAATYTPSNTYVAVRGSDEKVYYTFFFGLVYAPWVKADGLVTDTSPSDTYHAPDGTVWIAAREKTTGIIKRTRVNLNSYEAWTQVGSVAYPAAQGPWFKPPAIVSDGSWVHVFVPQFAWPQVMWQTVFDGTGWGDWRVLLAGGGSTVQAATANVNGTTNLVSYWWYGAAANMKEQALD